MIQSLCRSFIVMLLLACAQAWAQLPQPRVVDLKVADAPVIEFTDHGQLGRNVDIVRTFIGPGAKGEAMYAFCVPANPDRGKPADTPVLIRLNLETGAFHEYFKGTGAGLAKVAEPAMDAIGSLGSLGSLGGGDDLVDMPDSKAAAPLTKTWEWGTPTVATAAGGSMYFGDSTGQVLRYDPQQQGFQSVMSGDAAIAGIALGSSRDVWAITRSLQVIRYESLFGTERFVLSKAAADPAATSVAGLASDSHGWLYTAVGPAPWRVYALRLEKGRLDTRRLLSNVHVHAMDWHGDDAHPWCRIQLDSGKGAWQSLQLDQGRAVEMAADAVPVPKHDYEFQFDRTPRRVVVRRPGQAERTVSFEFSKATIDNIRTMALAPDGRTIVGGAHPNAFVWRFDPETNVLRRVAQHYNFYEMKSIRDRVYMIGYWGIKLMRWDPDQPWTFDYGRHYSRKQYPGDTSPWGSLDCNPQLICKFRYLRHLNIRRPTALAFGADGRVYAGAHDLGINLEWHADGYKSYGTGIRYAGALCWFDPQTQTIGYEAKDVDFEHYKVTDICSVSAGRYIAVAGVRRGNPFEPVPDPNLPASRLFLWDTSTHQFVDHEPATAGSILFVEEAEPGVVVGAGRCSGHTELFAFDTATMKTTVRTHVPLGMQWSSFMSPVRFERGPDRRIYFYLTGNDDAAMFRFDANTGGVQPVCRGVGIQRHGSADPQVFMYGNTFLFANDRVYFGANRLYSAPLVSIVGATDSLPAPLPAVTFAPAEYHPQPLANTPLPPEPDVVPAQAAKILPNVWQERHTFSWDLRDGARWASLGHSAAIVCFVPLGEADHVTGVDVSVRRVLSFDDDGQPATTELVRSFTVAPSADAGSKHRTWRELMHAPGYPPRQTVAGSAFRYCLNGVWTGTAQPVSGDGGARVFSALRANVQVIEFLRDDAVPTTSRWIEPTHGPSHHWCSLEEAIAPWCAGSLHGGRLTLAHDGTIHAFFTGTLSDTRDGPKDGPGSEEPTMKLRDEVEVLLDDTAGER